MKNKNNSKENSYKFKAKFKKLLNEKKNKKKSKKYIIYMRAIFFIFLISFIICLIKIFQKYLFMKKNKIDYNNLMQVINKYKRENIIMPIKQYIKYQPILSEKELEIFSYLMNPKNIYFEFGAGGSTNIASFYNMTVYSVESDKNWHKKLKDDGINAIYITIDLKANGNGGNPGRGTTVDDWKLYIQAYKKEYNADIILIDGRFRVACALDIFSKIRNDAIVLIHDYFRIEYHIVEDYYYKINQWDTLAAFIKKPNISSVPLDVYNKYLFVKL